MHPNVARMPNTDLRLKASFLYMQKKTWFIFQYPYIGIPDPPDDLGYNDGVVIERSVDLQWTRPSYTGGVAVMKYSANANEKRLEVVNSSRIVRFNTSHLVYGEVKVSAINTCGQESQPAAINIPAAGDCTFQVSNAIVLIKHGRQAKIL